MKDNSILKKHYELLAPNLIKALEKRGMEAYYVSSKDEALEKVLSLLDNNSSISWGGSVTLEECGIIEKIKSGGYKIVNREIAKTKEEKLHLMQQAMTVDYYLMSTNALSEDGILVNVDGNGNRVAAMCFGPRNVIIVTGMNKVCKSEEDAERRARYYCAPINALRIKVSKTPCVVNGSCSNCTSEECLCCCIVKTRMSRIPGRIKIILVGEDLGY